MRKLLPGTLFTITLIVVMVALFSIDSPTLSGNPVPTEAPWYAFELTQIAEDAR